jgi:PST family polysaccharide transporter
MLKYRLNPHLLFDSTAISLNLATKSVRGGVITMASTILMFVINMSQSVILARLLTPEDYGIVGMVSVIIGIVALFKDAGLSIATVQQEKITPDQISTLFWINMLISVVFGLIILVSAPLIAWFYEKPQLTLITVALAISFMIGGISIQHNALLKRHMRFDLLTIKTIASALLSLAVSIVLAILGFQYWALIIGSITLTLSEVLLTLFFCPWMPGKWKRNSGTRVMFKFGMHLTGFDFVNYFSRNLDNILIGRFIGSEGLGLYNKAYQIMLIPIGNIRNPINQVALPALSQLQNEPIRFRNYFLKIIDILATFSFPIFTYLYFESPFIIHLLLGSQWNDAIGVFRILVLGGFFQIIVSQTGLILISLGKSKKYFWGGLVYGSLTILSFIIGIFYGIYGVATAYAISQNLLFIPYLIYASIDSPVNWVSIFKKLVLPIVISFAAIISIEFCKMLWKSNEFIFHFMYAAIFIICFSLLTYLRKDFRKTILVFIMEIKNRNGKA